MGENSQRGRNAWDYCHIPVTSRTMGGLLVPTKALLKTKSALPEERGKAAEGVTCR